MVMTGLEIPTSKWQVEAATLEHVPQIQALFKSVFKQEMSLAQWHWKYGDDRGAGTIVRHGNEVVAFFGGTKRRVLFNGEAICSIQCGDSMVSTTHRGTLSKKGPFYLSVTSFLNKYVGFNRPYLLSYGFPNARAMRLAERLGLYAEVGNLVNVAWNAKSSTAFKSVEFDFDSAIHQGILDELWSNMASEFADRSIGVRDIEYLRHRYHDHPVLNYNCQLVYVQTQEKPLGIIITRQVEDRLLLLDMISVKSHIQSLADYGRHLASSLDCLDLYGWMTEVDLPLFKDPSVKISDTPLRLPLGVYCDGLKPEEIQDKWFLMCGDSDFL